MSNIFQPTLTQRILLTIIALSLITFVGVFSFSLFHDSAALATVFVFLFATALSVFYLFFLRL